jgi:mRNA-degrading endonuclease toxin of MazEF toxin-antitoxin module
VNRGDVWIAEVGRKSRPVLVLTRTEVLDVRRLVTVAEISTNVRGLVVEVAFDHADVGLDRPSVINCDGIHTVPKECLTMRVGGLDDAVMADVCGAVSHAIGC